MTVLQGPYVRPDGSLAVETRETLREVEALLRESLPRLSLGKDLAPASPTGVPVHTLGEAKSSAALEVALRDLLGRSLPWLRPESVSPTARSG